MWSGAGPVEWVFGGAVRGPIGRKSKVSRPPPSPLPPRSNSTTPPIFEVPQCPVSNSSPPPLGRVSRGPRGRPRTPNIDNPNMRSRARLLQWPARIAGPPAVARGATVPPPAAAPAAAPARPGPGMWGLSSVAHGLCRQQVGGGVWGVEALRIRRVVWRGGSYPRAGGLGEPPRERGVAEPPRIKRWV